MWGSEDVNVEGWKALKRLPGHDSGVLHSCFVQSHFLLNCLETDVTDLAFSPGDRYLASVGLDSKVLIWNGANLELLRKLDMHQGFVKGVCWDPVGQYLATQASSRVLRRVLLQSPGDLPQTRQSDDRSVKIWNTTDWSLETSITAPFEKSPSAFFTRLRQVDFSYGLQKLLNFAPLVGLLMALTLLLLMQKTTMDTCLLLLSYHDPPGVQTSRWLVTKTQSEWL